MMGRYDNTQWEEIYMLIERFLKLINFSNRKFAKFVGIPPTTFQTMLNKKSKMKEDTLLSIIAAMGELENTISLDDPDEQHEIEDIVDGINGIYMNRHLDDKDYESIRRSTLKRLALLDDLNVQTEENSPFDYTFNSRKLASAWANLSEQERQEIMAVADDIANETLKSQKMNLQLFTGKGNLSRLLDAFNQLNEKGQQTAADRVQELTQIETYRKKED